MILSIEEEMQKTGVTVHLNALKNQLHNVQDLQAPSDEPVVLDASGELIDPYAPEPDPPAPPVPPPKPKVKDWGSLFKAQGPSTGMKLKHYPELQQDLDAPVELDEYHLDDKNWGLCLIGYFLDGRMDFPLLCSTARRVWKDCGPIKIRQFGACFFFEFQDEDSKNKVLEGGPYFFSRRYLVLKEWERMLAPSTEHPSTIPVWVKIHKLPLECWTEEGLSRIASKIGKPLHVDVATAGQQRIAFARVCIEIGADYELPSTISVLTAKGTVVVTVEYQWLPRKCSKCKVFGHSCSIKATTADPIASTISGIEDPKAVWQNVGKVDSRPTSSTIINGAASSGSPRGKIQSEGNSRHSDNLEGQTPFRSTPTPSNKTAAKVPQHKYSNPPPAHPNHVPTDSVTKCEPQSKMVSSMLHELHTNSFHVLEEVTPPDEENQGIDTHLLDNDIPPDKNPFFEDIKNTNFEDDADYESPSSPVTNPFDCYSSDVPTSERSKKQQKKARKLAKQRASSKSKN